MRMILGLDRPTAGSVAVNGKPFAAVYSAMREVGALLDAKAVHGGRSAYNHLLCLAETNAIPRRRVDEVIGIVGLQDVARKRSKGFSLGMSQRLGIAAALLGDPDVLMFDEPVNGLDPEGIRWIRLLMRSLAAEGRTVFVSSHLMSEMENTADHLKVLASIGWAVLNCAGVVSHGIGPDFNAAEASLTGQVALGELIIVVLGALVITSEYSTGMIRTSLAVMPRRGVLYAAKAIVFAAVTLALSLITSFTSFFIGQAILSGKHYNTTVTQSDVLRAVLLSAAIVTVFGLLAYGAGALVRHTAGAITSILGVIFLIPALARALPNTWYADVVRWLPGGEALSPIARSAPPLSPHLFSAWGEFAVFSGYAVVLLALGAWSFIRRDA